MFTVVFHSEKLFVYFYMVFPVYEPFINGLALKKEADRLRKQLVQTESSEQSKVIQKMNNRPTLVVIGR